MKVSNLLLCLLLILCSIIASAVAYFYLPNVVAIHWNLRGEANEYGSRWMALMLLPILMILMVLLFTILPRIFVKQFNIKHYESTYFYCMVLVIALIGYVHVITLWANVSGQLDLSRTLVGGVALFFLLVGNVMGKVRRNYWLGIRTPWTLTSEQVWYATHRFSAKSMVATALIVLIAVFAGLSIEWCLVLLLLSVVMPAIYSYIIFRTIQM